MRKQFKLLFLFEAWLSKTAGLDNTVLSWERLVKDFNLLARALRATHLSFLQYLGKGRLELYLSSEAEEEFEVIDLPSAASFSAPPPVRRARYWVILAAGEGVGKIGIYNRFSLYAHAVKDPSSVFSGRKLSVATGSVSESFTTLAEARSYFATIIDSGSSKEFEYFV